MEYIVRVIVYGYYEGRAEIDNEPILIFPSSPLILLEITNDFFFNYFVCTSKCGMHIWASH